MTTLVARAPGLAVEVVRPAPAEEPLRSDIAAFIGATRRGPIGVPVRVVGWRQFVEIYGPIDGGAVTPYAVRGYFDNGGEVAWIVRAARPDASTGRCKAVQAAADLGLATDLVVEAASPGPWSDGLEVALVFRGRNRLGEASVDVSITAGGEREELRAVPAAALGEELARRSQLVRIAGALPTAVPGLVRTSAALRGAPANAYAAGSAAPAEVEDYLAALDRLREVPEVALLAMPDLHQHIGDPARLRAVVQAACASAEELHDRLVVLDLPLRARWLADEIAAWIDTTLGRGETDRTGEVRAWRAAALYHGAVRVRDPAGTAARPTRDVPPAGHVIGVISRLDRERGAHATPANALVEGIVDLATEYRDVEQAYLNPRGVNLVRCVPGLGFAVWGGRTLDRGAHRFVAHRRLVHRLVRLIRKVAEPLVFETNGPVLWFTFVRAITAVLLAAWRAGALAGARPDEAFRVKCDAETNPPDELEGGRCLCLVELAPATPMEFITVRIALSRDGALEVLQ